MHKYFYTVILSVLIAANGLYAQSFEFEGSNLILQVPQNHQVATCAIRYAPPTRDVKITDLDNSTPMNLRSCGGSGTSLTSRTSTTATIRASNTSYKWCFEGEDDKYMIEFQGDQYAPEVKYIWPANLNSDELGFYNIKKFGAIGDGRTDDTLAIQSALAYIATRNGGHLRFPEGEYLVGGTPGFQGLALPSGIVIEGASGLSSGASTNNIKRINPSRITLTGTNRSLFRIGECTEHVTFKDIELYSLSSNKTIGIEATGAYTTSQGFQFERITIQNFFRGIQVEGLPQTDLNWQFDYIKIRDSRFYFNTDAGIYCNTRNSDWRIEGSVFANPRKTATQNAISMHWERVGGVVMEDTFGGGFPNAIGGTFINILDSGPMTVIGSQAENVTASLVYNEVENPYAGDYSHPMTFVNSVFGEPMIFKARRTFISSGSSYGPRTFQADERLRVYSTGDRFCYDGYILGCRGATKNNFDRATVIFMTAQPAEGSVQGHSTYFGTDVDFGSTIKLPSFRANQLPNGKPNGSMVYCEDCRRNTSTCQSGGGGAPALVVNGTWSCL